MGVVVSCRTRRQRGLGSPRPGRAAGVIDVRRHCRTEVFAFLAAVIIGEKLIVVFGGPAQRLGDPSPTARKAPPPGRTMPHGPASTDESTQARRQQAE